MNKKVVCLYCKELKEFRQINLVKDAIYYCPCDRRELGVLKEAENLEDNTQYLARPEDLILNICKD